MDWSWPVDAGLNWSSGDSPLLDRSSDRGWDWSGSLNISSSVLHSLRSWRQGLLINISWQGSGQLSHKRVRVVWSFASSDSVEPSGCCLNKEALLPSVKDTGCQQDLVAVRLGVVLVAHVVHKPGPVPPGHRDEAPAQQTGHLARRSLARRVRNYFLCHLTTYQLGNQNDTENYVDINPCLDSRTK